MSQTVKNTAPALDSTARFMAWVYAAVAPNALSAARVENVLSLAGIPSSAGRIDAGQTERSNRELIVAGLAHRKAEGGVAVASEHALPLMRAALAAGRLEVILDAVLASRPDHSHDRFECEAMLRGSLLAGDVARFERGRKSYPYVSVQWAFLAEPFAADIVGRLPPTDLSEALDHCLEASINRSLPVDPIIDACGRGSSPARHIGWIGYARALQGRFDDAERLFEDLPLNDRRTKTAKFAVAVTRGLTAMLRGDDDRALLHIEEALAIESGNRKRFVFPKSRAFHLSLLALVRADLPESQELLAKILAARTWQDEQTRELELVERATAVKAKSGIYFGRYTPTGTLDVLFQGLVNGWLGVATKDGGERGKVQKANRERAAASGFAWVAAEYDEVLRRAGEDPYPAANGQADGHAALGTVTLATLNAPPPGPRRALQMLEQLIDRVDDTVPGGSTNGPQRRLIWELHHGGSSIFLEVREQQCKAGSWSKGRQLGVKRLSALAAKEDFLLPQDRDAIAGAQKGMRYRAKDDFLGVRSLYALAGHPHVFDTDGHAVDVVRREPDLSVAEDGGGGVTVRLEPHRSGTDGEYTAHMVGDRRCEVTQFTPAHRRLQAVIGEAGLLVPAQDKARLLDVVSALSSAVRVQSTTAATGATQVEADATPWVRLEPLDGGLSVAVVVEPVPNSGVFFEAGAGGAVVFAGREGEGVQAQRDLEAERRALNELVRDCALLASRPSQLHPLNLPLPEQCLELLEQLELAQARCKWPKGESLRIVGRAGGSSFRLKVKSAAQWIGVSGELVVDEDHVLNLKQLFHRLDTNPGSRFLALGDGQFVSLTSAFRRQLDDFANLATPLAKGTVRLNPLAVPALVDLIDGAELDADQGWLDWRAELEATEASEPGLPSTLQAELRPYQHDGFRWLARLARWGAGACLADDMGLGKTVQTLAVLLEQAPGGPALVVAPTSVVPNWLAEARRFAPTLNVKAYTGAAGSRTAMLAEAAPFDVFVTTYGVLQNDADDLAAVRWRCAVLDEAQAIKNPNAKRTEAARRLNAHFRVVTTGTPVQNNLMDLYSLFGFVNPGLFGSLRQFRARFLLPIERDGNAAAQRRLRRLIAPFVLRRLKSDVLDDLPERTEITLHVEMSESEANVYEALRQRALEDLEAVGERGGQMQLLAHLTRLRLACCNPKLVLGEADAPPSSKLAAFAATLDDLLQNNHKVLVFSQFVMHLRLVEEHLQREGIRYQYLDGGTPSKVRTERINAFQAADGDVFLISLKAGGVGLNLTAADYVIHMDPWWNPAVEDQASDRAHRIGQKRPVTIYRLVTRGTIEDQIVDLHHRKRDLADRLLEGTDAPDRLSADELLGLLRRPLDAGYADDAVRPRVA